MDIYGTQDIDNVTLDDEMREWLQDPNGDRYKTAKYQYDIIVEEIADFEKDLNADEEIAIKLCHFGEAILLNVTDIAYHEPYLIFYYGYVNNKYAQLIQHMNQISFLLLAVPKSDLNKPAKRIAGFLANR